MACKFARQTTAAIGLGDMMRMREAGMTYRAIAERAGVSHQRIHQLVNRDAHRA